MVFDEGATEAAEKFVKGARVYVEGKLSISEWTGQDGATRHGLSVMSWHCRLSQIGRNKPARNNQPTKQPEPQSKPEFNDEIPF
jgi:single-stranded DNA-binding protein